MERFDPPGYLDDFSEAEKDRWSEIVSGWLDEACAGRPAENDGPRGQFFNALTSPPAAGAQVAVISWNAFPRRVRARSLSDAQRWQRADADRNVQDEYCEWSVTRDPITRKIVRIDFTCEGPEYWEALAALNPDKVVELYRRHVSPSATRADLFVGTRYNRLNRFNDSTTNGAMHLIQGANSLRAEIELGAAATIRRMQDGHEITDAQALIRCSRYGDPGRNSDPHIGEQVNALARQRADITLNNPVGLYFHDFNPVGWTTPDGQDPRRFWVYVRGKEGYNVRAVFEVPPDRGYTVGDIKIAGRPIAYGAQVADFVTIKLEGLATRIGASAVAPVAGCRGAAQPPSLVAESLAPSARRVDTQAMESLAAAPDALGDSGLTSEEREIVSRLPPALRRELEIVEDDGAAPPALLPYPKLPDTALRARRVTGKMLAYASPDSTYAVTKKLLDSAQSSIVIGIYDFSASYMKDALKRAMRRGVSVSLMLDTNDADDPGLFAELRRLGANCVKAPSSSAGSPNAYFGNAHEKIIVVDGELVMIQSGNWSENSIPENEGDGVQVGQFMAGNRDMGLAVHSPDLARFFSELVARDMRLARGEPAEPPVAIPVAAPPDAGTVPPAVALFFEAAPPSVPPLFPSRTFTPSTPVRVAPVVTPENYHTTTKRILRGARRSLRIEQQYIRGGQPAIEELLDAIKAARRDSPEMTIQIIVSPKYLYGSQKAKFLRAMEECGLDFGENYRFLSSRHFVHCHNKLIVIDDEKVLLGSQNWSTTGVRSNRETSLLVDHAGVAEYFAAIFDSDWCLSEPSGAPPDDLGLVAYAVRDAADFARGGLTMSSTRDYVDV